MKCFIGALIVALMSFCASAYYEVGDWRVDYDSENNKIVLRSYHGEGSSVTIPEKLTISVFNSNKGEYDDVRCSVILGEALFQGNTKIVSVSLGGHTDVPARCFCECSSLATVKSDAGLVAIGDRAFYGCGSLLLIPSLEQVASIGGEAFRGCGKLAIDMDLPHVNNIGGGAFYGCGNVYGIVNLPKASIIGNETFLNCTSLTSVVIGNVSSMGNCVFEKCTSITEAKIGGSTDIRGGIFLGCTSLRKVELLRNTRFEDFTVVSGIFGYATRSISPFEGCTNLEEVTLGDRFDKILWRTFMDLKKLKRVTVGCDVKHIDSQAFSGCSELASFPSLTSVTNIGDGAFGGCNNLTGNIELPKTKDVGNSAFRGCASITSFMAPQLSTLGQETFVDCTSLKECYVSGDATIRLETFLNCSSLERVELDGNICFADSFQERWAWRPPFGGCTNLREVALGANFTWIPRDTFNGLYSLTNVSVNSSLLDIHDGAFANCSSLQSVTGADSVRKINGSAFLNCLSLESFDGFSTVTNIGGSAFSGCSSLTGKVELVKVKTVESGTFKGCERIRQVKFGKDLEIVRADAFSGSTNLIAFTFEGVPPETDDNAFRNVKKGALGIYPTSTLQFDDSQGVLQSVQTLSETSEAKKWCDVIAEDGTWKNLVMVANKPVLTNDVYYVNEGALRLNWENKNIPEKPLDYGITYEIRRGFSDNYESADILTNGYEELTYIDKQFDFTGGVSRIWYWVKPEHECVKFDHSDACRTKNRYMINVGIDNYKDSRQDPLKYCVSDAQGWARRLGCDNYEPYLSDGVATKENICIRLKDLSNKVTPGDLFVYTHSSHGNRDLLCCYDENLTAEEFGNQLKQFSKYTRIIVIIDACYSGSIPSGMDARAMRMQSASQAEEGTFVDSVIEYMDSPRMGMLSSGTGDSTTISSSSEIGWLTAVSTEEQSKDGVYCGKCLQSAGWENSGADHDNDGWITFEDLGKFANYWMTRVYDWYGMTPQMINPDKLRVLAGKVASKNYNKIENAPSISLNENTDPYTISFTINSDSAATGYDVRAYNVSANIFRSYSVLGYAENSKISIVLNAINNDIPISSDSFNIYVKATNPMDVSEHSNVINARMRESESINEGIRKTNESRPDGAPSIVNEDGSNDYESLNQDPDGDGRTTFQEIYAGSDPFDGNSQFSANITMESGKPKVTYSPDLGEARKYTVYGRKDLGNASDEWVDMSAVADEEQDQYRFFKVGVELP